jgi:hypothetical protein
MAGISFYGMRYLGARADDNFVRQSCLESGYSLSKMMRMEDCQTEWKTKLGSIVSYLGWWFKYHRKLRMEQIETYTLRTLEDD